MTTLFTFFASKCNYYDVLCFFVSFRVLQEEARKKRAADAIKERERERKEAQRRPTPAAPAAASATPDWGAPHGSGISPSPSQRAAAPGAILFFYARV